MDNKYYKLIASLALLRTLYNNDKKNVYHVIAEMAREVIVENRVRSFTVTDLANQIKKKFGVSLLNPVLSYSLKRLTGLNQDRGQITVTSEFQTNISAEVEHTSEISRQNNDYMLEDLCSFIESKKGEKLSDTERSQVKIDMCYYVSHDSVDSPYKGYIGSFYMEKQKEGSRACEVFNTIYEGKILYDALSGGSECEIVDIFDRPLKVYLETEILFHATGLNGELYQHLFMQFYEQVEKINQVSVRKQQQKVISLKYFSETEDEIKGYFSQAEQILEKKSSMAIPGSAMDLIVSSCKSPADVRIKEKQFWEKLRRLGILLEDSKFDSVKNSKYNLISDEELSRAKVNHDGDPSYNDEQRAYDVLAMLSYINYNRRNNNSRSYKTAGSIMVTGRGMTLDYSSRLTPQGDVPFALTLSSITNRFWFSINNGLFDPSHSITSSQLLSFAQIAVCQQINDTLKKEHESLSKQIMEGTLTIEEAQYNLAAVHRGFAVSPDEVPALVEDSSCYDLFDRESIARKIEERDLDARNKALQLEVKDNEIKAKSKALKNLLKIQNDKEREAYNTRKLDYDSQMTGFIRKKIIREMICSCLIVIVCLFSFIVPAYFVLFKLESAKLKWLGIIFMVILAVIDMCKDFIHSKFIYSLRFIFRQGVRRAFRIKNIIRYRHYNKMPELIISKEEDYYR